MNQLHKYTWVIETIRCAGKISHKDQIYDDEE